ncbi:MAG: hypothetical protein DWQ47_04185 [Acidobacteria bacterium]|nr:MAG: hypothetical protein DWQ32_07735 [Acidobacteriota bacterium]REK01593.1 MAG: hypothetical protein DWQ38_04170 [Acidobacteriota bacterium]REK14549.1 MAG: hypothetical protein DWQ43_13425 [Acidobacteriota bacterium]REK45264.1 MAG: hypothetical protein DWQ47_04185 [Acidobacteriota bacterium]
MAWIKTIKPENAEGDLLELIGKVRETYPKEYGTVHPQTIQFDESIIESHTLIPDALYHSFMLLSTLLKDDLPLERRQQEMIATVVSDTNDCFY